MSLEEELTVSMTVNGEARRPDLRRIGDMGRLYLNVNETPEPECNITGVGASQRRMNARQDSF